ncbi:hypothetical protein ACIRJO_22900 [Streptomyces sp. NPDC102394]|uniref:hypothetical protein n=1 Tax=Streptomyces sp. NPDC102394 TaxID=3366167 RepID=UPI00382AB17B
MRGESDAGERDDHPPGGEAGVDGAGVLGEETLAYGGVDAVRGDDQVGLQFAVAGAHAGRAAGVARVGEGRGVRADGARREQRGQAVDEGGPVQQDQGAAEAPGCGLRAGAGEPAAGRGAQSAVALPGGEVPDLVAQADDVEGAQGVAWADGLVFSCVAGSFNAETPSPEQVRAGLRELLDGMLGGR